MNNKGFTLIELLVVIAMIGLLATIFIPNVTGMIRRHNRNMYNESIDTVIEAAKQYVANNRYEPDVYDNIKNCTSNGTKSFTKSIQDLITSGDLSGKPDNKCKDSGYNTPFNTTDKVTITFNCSTKQFTYSFVKPKIPETKKEC